MSGNELGRRGKASRGKKLIDGMERSELTPKLLIPTPAQLEQGIMFVDAPEDDWPNAVRLAVKRAEGAGWAWRVTYSEFLAVSPATGADAGQWITTHSMVLRVNRGADRAWASWHGTQRKGWWFEAGQYWGMFMPYAAAVDATAFSGLITGTMTMRLAERTGEKLDEHEIFYVVEKVAQPALARA